MPDLWPDDLIQQSTARTPVTILQEQATALGKRTRNLVTAKVSLEEFSSLAPSTKSDFTYVFAIVGPTIGNYQYKLLEIAFDIRSYPVYVDAEPDVHNEVKHYAKTPPGGRPTILYAASEEEFTALLRAIFNTSKVKQVVSAILSQSTSGAEHSKISLK